MTDEQRPWRAWPEYERVTGARWSDVSIGMLPHIDLLCARVWRKAYVKGQAYEANAQWAQLPRLKAAEAQRDRLSAALRRLHDAIDDFNAGSEKDDDARQHLCWLCGASTYGGDGVIHEPRCALLDARAALADSGEQEPGYCPACSEGRPNLAPPWHHANCPRATITPHDKANCSHPDCQAEAALADVREEG